MGSWNCPTTIDVDIGGHPVVSAIDTEYEPGPTNMDGVVSPVFHRYEYGGDPPPPTAVIVVPGDPKHTTGNGGTMSADRVGLK
jgi:hypothetical protein